MVGSEEGRNKEREEGRQGGRGDDNGTEGEWEEVMEERNR